MSYSRFLQYVHYLYPAVRLTRTAEDVCDCCVRIDIQLKQPDLSDDERQSLHLKKQMHLDSAMGQRRFISSFIKSYSALHAPEQSLPECIIPDTYDAAEDYGGGISMPYYGHVRPSADYFNSNLILQNFVVADISNGVNNVYFYDERAQGKYANALCSLRLNYPLSIISRAKHNEVAPPEVSFSTLDNCVGQNKSKAVLMFFAFRSVVFPYKKVVLCYLLPGHSHNIADRVIAWCRRATRGLNLYTPKKLIKEVNKVKSVQGVKYFIPPPGGST
ncbi:uncharacterized protein PITG_20075 [Phytophthora infestans T30-4]|uniref:DUF7869 domain-containing protein n=1 Tax=Phytophthora infestans (strain T30-4) TaxID=403677 RepID=D0P132_PHYIT|nr:uncharacterized protein PITG_20075 [Phytophthora infestans T30-4]EEY53747.1 conserved hypothetical protein [Phytophthora infestans T30-4]|eukprot:XP_002895994.1 conserved hypothetical protein [Phytophthora infestans T30-4]